MKDVMPTWKVLWVVCPACSWMPAMSLGLDLMFQVAPISTNLRPFIFLLWQALFTALSPTSASQCSLSITSTRLTQFKTSLCTVHTQSCTPAHPELHTHTHSTQWTPTNLDDINYNITTTTPDLVQDITIMMKINIITATFNHLVEPFTSGLLVSKLSPLTAPSQGPSQCHNITTIDPIIKIIILNINMYKIIIIKLFSFPIILFQNKTKQIVEKCCCAIM